MPFQTQVYSKPRIAIYQFSMYDITSDTKIQSKRWGTESAISENNGSIIRETQVLVDSSVTESDIPGLTKPGYMP